ncbi:MAG: AraC family transcriptional regulator [Pseudomonadota bacterium]
MSLEPSDITKNLPETQELRFAAHRSRDGLYIGGYDVQYTEGMRLSVRQEPGLFLGLMLSGRSTRLLLTGIGEFEIPVGRPIIMNFSEETECTNFYEPGEHCAGVGLHVPPEFFDRLGDDVVAMELEPLRELLGRSTDVEVFDACPEMAKLSARILETGDSPTSSALELEGAGYLLLARFCAKLTEARDRPSFGKLGESEWRRVMKVSRHLNGNLTDTPSLGELSRLAGVNQTTLSDQFKVVHGETIFAYLRNRRLEEARAILRCEGASITETSFRVGFASATSFATAYRRRFGYPPSQETSDNLDRQ